MTEGQKAKFPVTSPSHATEIVHKKLQQIDKPTNGKLQHHRDQFSRALWSVWVITAVAMMREQWDTTNC